MNRGLARRGHLSKKVPGVKLRPTHHLEQRDAPDGNGDGTSSRAESSSRAVRRLEQERLDAQARREVLQGDADGAADDIAEQERLDALHAKPLAGCTVCITGIKSPRRDELARHLVMMGATHERDLTEDVTHLVADKPGSAKYKCAAKLGMKILTEHWVTAIRREWMEARQIDLEQITAEHTMPPLYEMNVALTGYGAGSRSFEDSKRIQRLGGKFCPSFDAKAGITHVVCGTDDLRASDTMVHLQEIRDQPRAPKAVRTQWLEDCEDTGVCVDEDDYLVHKPMPNMEDRLAFVAQVHENYVARHITLMQAMEAAQKRRIIKERQGALPVKRRREPSGESTGHVSPAKPSALAAMATELVRAGRQGPEEQDRKPQRSKWADDEPPEDTKFKPRSDPHKRSEQNRALGDEQLKAKRAQSDSIVERKPLGLSQERSRMENACPKEAASALQEAPVKLEGSNTFAGQVVCVLDGAVGDKEKAEKLKDVLRLHGADIAGIDDWATYTICGYSQPPEHKPQYGHLVTALWVEVSVTRRQCVDPGERIGLVPTAVPLPIKTTVPLLLHVTGCDTRDGLAKHSIDKVVVALGGRMSPSLTRKDTHLLIAQGGVINGTKVARAKEWGIPIVDMEFIRRAYEEGVFEPEPSARPDISQHGSTSTPTTAVHSEARSPRRRPTPPKAATRPAATLLPIEDSIGRETAHFAEQITAQLSKASASSGKQERRRPRPRVRPGSSKLRRTDSGERSRSVSVFDMDDEALSAPSEAVAADEDSAEEHVELQQTQVVVSYDNPKARREQRKLMAMLQGEAPGESLMSNRTDSMARTPSTAVSTDMEVNKGMTAAALSPRRSRSSLSKQPIKARQQPGVKR